MGTINNLIHVKKSDFEVFDALKVDSLESSETSGRGEFCGIIALHVLFSTSSALRFAALGAQPPWAEVWPCTGDEECWAACPPQPTAEVPLEGLCWCNFLCASTIPEQNCCSV